MMTMIPSIRIVRHTMRFADMREFYEVGLDMRPIAEWDRGADDRGVLLVFNGPTSATSFEILTHPGIAATTRVLGSGEAGGLTVAVEVANVGARYETLTGRGMIIAADIANQPWGHRSFSLRDPDGLEISFFQDMTAGVGGSD